MLIATTKTKGYGAHQPRQPQRAASKAGSRRSCVGCGQRVALGQARAELMRLVLVPRSGSAPERAGAGYDVVVDLACRSAGRGAWVHTRKDCVSRAIKRGLSRSAKGRVHTSVPALHQAICAAAERRAGGLLSSAWRTRSVAIGVTAAQEALDGDRVALLLVARDAASAARSQAVATAQARGLALAWLSDKRHLGDVLGRREVAVVAITDAGLADALRAVISCWETFGSELDRAGSASGEQADRERSSVELQRRRLQEGLDR